MIDIRLDLTEMRQLAREAREKMKQVAAQAMGEYIDFFTEPIWESDEDDDEEEEED